MIQTSDARLEPAKRRVFTGLKLFQYTVVQGTETDTLINPGRSPTTNFRESFLADLVIQIGSDSF